MARICEVNFVFRVFIFLFGTSMVITVMLFSRILRVNVDVIFIISFL